MEVEVGLNKEPQELCQQLSGHPIPCASGSCSSLIRTNAAIAVHYPKLRSLLHLLYCAKKYHQCILDIDSALSAADFNHLMIAAGVSDSVQLFQSDHTVHNNSQGTPIQQGLPGLEAKVYVKHATVITQFEEKLNDDPKYACCSCERLLQRKAVTSMKNSGQNFSSPMWQKLKQHMHIIQQGKDVNIDSLYICQYCRPCLNSNSMPSVYTEWLGDRGSSK